MNWVREEYEKGNKYDKLLYDLIIGVIDRNGVAHSRKFFFEDAPTHEDLFPLIHEKRWRWDWDKGIVTTIYGDTFDEGDGDIIRNHLRREYGIRFWGNGYHDIDYLQSKMTKSDE